MTVDSLPDITAPDGNAHALSATSLKVRWFQVNLISSTSGIRVGALANVAAGRGAPIATGAGQFFPEHTSEEFDTYDLSLIGYIGTTSDKLSVLYGV